MNDIFLTGTDTGCGKTLVSAIFAHAYSMAYWKPIQSGELENSDTLTVKKYLGEKIETFKEAYRFKLAASPHISASSENQKIDLNKIQIPESRKPLVIEGAGGVLVPLNSSDLMIDLISRINKPVVIVSKSYLGSINHSLLTFEALEKRKIPVLGWVINGEENTESDLSISHFSKKPILLRIYPESKIDLNTIKKYAQELKKNEAFYGN